MIINTESLIIVGFVLFVALMIITAIGYLVLNIRTIRLFGFDITVLSGVIFLAFYFYVMVIMPLPEYYIKSQYQIITGVRSKTPASLGDVVGDVLIRNGIEYTPDSLVMLDVNSMNFNVLFLCSYESDGNQDTALFRFKRNIFGDLKPEAPIVLGDVPVTFALKDGALGTYLVEAGCAGSSDPKSGGYDIIEGFAHNKTLPESAYLWVEFVDQSWLPALLLCSILFIVITISANIGRRKRGNISDTVYVKWRPGDKVVTVTKNPSEDEYDN